MKILVVDGNPENLLLLELWLKKSSYEVVSTANGAEALEKLNSDAFSLIISDVLMPVMDGFQLCKKVNSDDNLRSIPFVFYTASYTDKKDEELALKLGAARFIRKSAYMFELMAIVDDLCKGHNTSQSNKESNILIQKDDEDSYKLYNEILVKKLEDKMLLLKKEVSECERTGKMLKRE